VRPTRTRATSGASPTYDPNGNLKTYGEWIYNYDGQNRLTSATGNGHSAVFYYDGRNRQIARVIDNQVQFSVWDDWELIEEYASPSVRSAAYLQGAHGVIKSILNNVYYYQDSLGSTTHLADGAGHLLESYRYDLYGKPSYFSSTAQPLNSSTFSVVDLYAGERWIPDLGLYDLRNRFMSPELGRFIQADPIEFKGDASNLYRYCHNDPADFSDPSGLLANDAWSRLMHWQSSCFYSFEELLKGRESQPAGNQSSAVASKEEGAKEKQARSDVPARLTRKIVPDRSYENKDKNGTIWVIKRWVNTVTNESGQLVGRGILVKEDIKHDKEVGYKAFQLNTGEHRTDEHGRFYDDWRLGFSSREGFVTTTQTFSTANSTKTGIQRVTVHASGAVEFNEPKFDQPVLFK
jgi:RHS repeat-associated protein